MLKDKFPDIMLWDCLNHRFELAVGNASEIIDGTNDFHSFLEHLFSLYSQSPKNKRELNQCSHDLQMTLKRIRKVFTVRWVASSFRAVSAVWHSFPALVQHFHKASNDESRQSTEKARFQEVLSKTLYNKFCLKFGDDSGYLEQIKKLIRNIAKPKYHANKSLHFTHCLNKTYRKPYCFPEGAFHFSPMSKKSNVIPGSKIERRKKPIINQAQFIRAVADNMKERLFTTASNRAQPSLHAARKEN